MRLPRWQDALLAAIALGIGATALVLTESYDGGSPAGVVAAPGAGASESPAQPRVLFVGGSLVAGVSRTPGTPTLAEVAAVELGWTAEVRGRAKAGFTVPGTGGAPPLRTLTPGDVDGDPPDVAVVQGGEADTQAPAAELDAAVTELCAALRTQLGLGTALVLVGPFSPTAVPAPALLAVRDTLKTAARRNRVHFLDPIAGGWVSASDPPGLVSSGSLLPTSQGHLEIGPLLAAGLRELDLLRGR